MPKNKTDLTKTGKLIYIYMKTIYNNFICIFKKESYVDVFSNFCQKCAAQQVNLLRYSYMFVDIHLQTVMREYRSVLYPHIPSDIWLILWEKVLMLMLIPC